MEDDKNFHNSEISQKNVVCLKEKCVENVASALRNFLNVQTVKRLFWSLSPSSNGRIESHEHV